MKVVIDREKAMHPNYGGTDVEVERSVFEIEASDVGDSGRGRFMGSLYKNRRFTPRDVGRLVVEIDFLNGHTVFWFFKSRRNKDRVTSHIER